MIELEFVKGNTIAFKSKLISENNEEVTKEQIESAFVTVREYPRSRISYNVSKDFK